jgi:hypothetical protein
VSAAPPQRRKKTDSPAASTVRWRRWYRRQRADCGEQFIPFKVDHPLVTLLLDAGKITERDSENLGVLAEVIRRCCVESCSNALDTSRKR